MLGTREYDSATRLLHHASHDACANFQDFESLWTTVGAEAINSWQLQVLETTT